jgi:hypothetical protein
MTDAIGPLPFCPGCGHEPLTLALDRALVKLQPDPKDVVIVTDIGCIGLSDRYFATSAFHGLHAYPRGAGCRRITEPEHPIGEATSLLVEHPFQAGPQLHKLILKLQLPSRKLLEASSLRALRLLGLDLSNRLSGRITLLLNHFGCCKKGLSKDDPVLVVKI